MDNGLVLMVVDDEKIIRRGIITQYDWTADGITDIIEATDGIDALNILNEKRPDIIITDVRMPQMNGLEFAKRVYELDSSIKMIILSGYDDFAYAQEAIKYNIVDYLLKPCSKEGISSAVKKCIEMINNERSKRYREQELTANINKSLPLLRERFLNRIMLNPYLEQKKLLEEYSFVQMGISNKDLCVIVLELDEDSNLEGWNAKSGRQLLNFAIVNVLNEMAEKINGVAIENTLGFFVVLLSEVNNASTFTAKHRVISFVQDCIQTITNNLEVQIYAGIGNTVESLELVGTSYREALLALKSRYALDADYIHIEDVFEIQDLNGNFPAGYEEKMFYKVITGDTDNIKTEIDDYIIYMSKYNFCTLEFLKSFFCGVFFYLERRLLELNINECVELLDKKALFAMIQMCNSVKEISENTKKILCTVADSLKEVRQNKNHMAILFAKQYINEHLDEPGLSLETLARRVNFSPNYFVSLFKQAEGDTPSEYITKQRMEQAKKLLITPNIQVYKVCKMVGYNDQRYFSQIFKKHFGFLPTEYVKSVIEHGVDDNDKVI